MLYGRDSDTYDTPIHVTIQVWNEAPEGECYLADGSGGKINGDDFPLSLRGEETMTLPWTLSNYMKISGAMFPSRMRFYCVNLHGQWQGKCKVYISLLKFQCTCIF